MINIPDLNWLRADLDLLKIFLNFFKFLCLPSNILNFYECSNSVTFYLFFTVQMIGLNIGSGG